MFPCIEAPIIWKTNMGSTLQSTMNQQTRSFSPPFDVWLQEEEKARTNICKVIQLTHPFTKRLISLLWRPRAELLTNVPLHQNACVCTNWSIFQRSAGTDRIRKLQSSAMMYSLLSGQRSGQISKAKSFFLPACCKFLTHIRTYFYKYVPR